MSNYRDFGFLAMEAEGCAEVANSTVVARAWREIAKGYRLLMEAAEQEAASQLATPLPDLAEHRGGREISWLLPDQSAARV